MYQGKHVKKTNKPAVLAASLVLALVVAVGGTLAFLSTHTEDVVNTFTPASVPPEIHETFDGKVKSNVTIKNTGEVDAYIRAAVVITWVDDEGNVYGELPEEGENGDYTITYDLSNGWVKKDGYYYWRSVVASKGNTGELLTCQLNKDATPPDGYTLSVEILAQSIQAMPEYVVEEVWGVTVNSDGTLNIQ